MPACPFVLSLIRTPVFYTAVSPLSPAQNRLVLKSNNDFPTTRTWVATFDNYSLNALNTRFNELYDDADNYYSGDNYILIDTEFRSAPHVVSRVIVDCTSEVSKHRHVPNPKRVFLR